MENQMVGLMSINEDGSLKREIFFVEGKAYEKDNDKKK